MTKEQIHQDLEDTYESRFSLDAMLLACKSIEALESHLEHNSATGAQFAEVQKLKKALALQLYEIGLCTESVVYASPAKHHYLTFNIEGDIYKWKLSWYPTKFGYTTVTELPEMPRIRPRYSDPQAFNLKCEVIRWVTGV